MSNRRMRPVTKRLFDEVLLNEGVEMIEGFRNPIKTIGDVTIIYIIARENLYECLIDTKDIEKLKNIGTIMGNWNGSQNNLYAIFTRNRKIIVLHRFLTACPGNKVIDHINRNSLDNRRCNLRIVTAGQNMLNKNKYSNSNSIKTNLTHNGSHYNIVFNRRFYNKNIAEEALLKLTELFNYYSEIDASQR